MHARELDCRPRADCTYKHFHSCSTHALQRLKGAPECRPHIRQTGVYLMCCGIGLAFRIYTPFPPTRCGACGMRICLQRGVLLRVCKVATCMFQLCLSYYCFYLTNIFVRMFFCAFTSNCSLCAEGYPHFAGLPMLVVFTPCQAHSFNVRH